MKNSVSSVSEKELNNVSMMLIDLIAGDEAIVARPEYNMLDMDVIQKALDFLLNNENLSPKEKAYLLENSYRVNYRDEPPNPKNFITEKYLGASAAHTYQYIKDVFVDFMDPTKPHRNLVLYPFIGFGKSYLSTLITIYINIHMSMMRNPYKYFGLNPATVLAQLLVSYSLKKSSELLLEPLIGVLEASPFFEKVHTRESMIKRDRDYQRMTHIDKIYWTTAVPTSAMQMSGGACIKLASNPTGFLGLSVISGTLSELAFFREAGKSDEFIISTFNKLKTRVDSRMKGNYFGRTILDSSPNTLDSPIDDYVVNHSRKDPLNYVVSGSVWDWRPEEFDMTKKFPVYTGGKGQVPKILYDDKELLQYAPEKIIYVPDSLKQYFEDDIYQSLKDRAGIPSGSADSLIYDYEKIEAAFDKRLKNIYTHITADESRNPRGLIWDQISPIFFRKRATRLEFWYKPELPRCIGIDQSLSGDVSCVSMAHVEKLRGMDELIYVVDFTIVIAPEGGRINLDAIRFFIEDLRNLGGLNIAHVSYDQFQSASSLQYLSAAGFETERLSVDNMDPYLNLVSLLNTKRLIVGRNLYVKNNLKSLRIVHGGDKGAKNKKKSKVDHDDSRPVVTTGSLNWETSPIGSYAKDATDAITAAVELLRKYHPNAYTIWDPNALDAMSSGEAEKKSAETNLKALLEKMKLG